jgi:hypothetical protein
MCSMKIRTLVDIRRLAGRTARIGTVRSKGVRRRILNHGWFFVDALMVMVLAVIYVLLTRRQSHWGERENVAS